MALCDLAYTERLLTTACFVYWISVITSSCFHKCLKIPPQPNKKKLEWELNFHPEVLLLQHPSNDLLNESGIKSIISFQTEMRGIYVEVTRLKGRLSKVLHIIPCRYSFQTEMRGIYVEVTRLKGRLSKVLHIIPCRYWKWVMCK